MQRHTVAADGNRFADCQSVNGLCNLAYLHVFDVQCLFNAGKPASIAIIFKA